MLKKNISPSLCLAKTTASLSYLYRFFTFINSYFFKINVNITPN